MHSDKQLLAKLLRRIADAGIAVVLIEHDMSLVMGISDHIAVLDAGKSIAQGRPDAVRNDPAVVAAYLGGAHFEARARAPAGSRRSTRAGCRDAGSPPGYGAASVLHDVDLRLCAGRNSWRCSARTARANRR